MPAGFNPRTRTGCDPRTAIFSGSTKAFQSTHPHGVRLDLLNSHIVVLLVSIHAPARGATAQPFNARPRRGVSIHAPARGATRTGWRPRLNGLFQSTHPHGVRLHAFLNWQLLRGFNPRTRTGCDFAANEGDFSVAVFQSTHPHGVRLHAFLNWQLLRGFNPRTRTGCDRDGGRRPRRRRRFNPRTRTGCDNGMDSHAAAILRFNPRTRTGCDAGCLTATTMR